jgi:hypothetical protein
MKARKLTMGIQNVSIVLAMLLGVALSAYGQVESGRFVGHITDAQGAAVPHAMVKVTNTGTNIVQTALTDSSGDFVITPVSGGTYTLSIMATGFQTINTSKIEVQGGQIVREDLNEGRRHDHCPSLRRCSVAEYGLRDARLCRDGRAGADLPPTRRWLCMTAELTPGGLCSCRLEVPGVRPV